MAELIKFVHRPVASGFDIKRRMKLDFLDHFDKDLLILGRVLAGFLVAIDIKNYFTFKIAIVLHRDGLNCCFEIFEILNFFNHEGRIGDLVNSVKKKACDSTQAFEFLDLSVR